MGVATAAAGLQTWTDRNQAHLISEFARLKRRLGLSTGSPGDGAPDRELDDADRHGEERTSDQAPTAVECLVELFRLSPFERDILLLCAGIEMDSELAARCAEAHGQPQRPYVTFGLAMATLAEPHWSAFAPSRPLRRHRLVEVAAQSGLASAPVRIDERILHYLAGINTLEPSLESLLTRADCPALMAQAHSDVAQRLVQFLEGFASHAPLLHLCGDDPEGQEDIAAFAAHRLGRQLFVLRAEDLPGTIPEAERLMTLLEREFLLLPAAFLIQCGTRGTTQAASYLTEKLPVTLFLAGRDPMPLRRSFVRLEVDKPAPAEQRNLWRSILAETGDDTVEESHTAADDLAQHFRLSVRRILDVGSIAASAGPGIRPAALWETCRALARPRLADLAQRIVPRAGWEDLVLPDPQMRVLRQLASQVRHRMKVHEAWGFARHGRRGLGVSALFCGESGTGKTLAAEVLACDLELDLYRIDLASVVSKYIGETEKNLKQLFDAAEEGGVLLLFDEADALFGKRGEVREAHDRYANIEVGYLLQRMESYQGLAVLTTNMKSSLDRAFQRRLRFTVTFPFPDAPQREAIWNTVFPAATPTRALNLKKLAQLNVTGGHIRNIALNASFLAANDDTPVEMGHLREAARLEALKLERPLAESELRGWA
jgi:hypothetical protein